MSNGAKLAIVFGIIILLGGGVFTYQLITERTVFNNGNVNGNSVGNLYGNGLYCEYGDKVYFANPSDNGRLYVMNKDETNVTKLLDDYVYYINTDGNYIYYCRNTYDQNSIIPQLSANKNSLCRVTMDGKRFKVLDDALSTYASLAGNRLYYFHYEESTATTLYSVGIDGKDKELLSKDQIDPRCAVGQDLYYSGVKADHYLHRLTGKNQSTVLTKNIWMPIIDGNVCYYMDLDDDYRLHRADMTSGNDERLTDMKVSAFNKHGSYIVFQTFNEDADGLYCLNLNDMSLGIIMAGQYKDINMTDNYVYFTDFYSDIAYHSTYLGAYRSEMFLPSVNIADFKK